MPINEQDRTRVPGDIMFLQINVGEVERCCAIGNLTAAPINSISDEPLPPTRLDYPQPWYWPPLTDEQINEIFEP